MNKCCSKMSSLYSADMHVPAKSAMEVVFRKSQSGSVSVTEDCNARCVIGQTRKGTSLAT